MGRLAKKYEQTLKAITSFEQALNQYQKWKTQVDPKQVESIGIDYAGIVLNLRDSMIQRFEYSIDLLWKYLKAYLDEKLNVVPEVLSPNNVIREAAKARLITEEEAESMLNMVKKRNLTSHIYHEELAEVLTGDLPRFLSIMHAVIAKIT